MWDVETAAARSIASKEAFCGITFRDRSDRESEVVIGWVPSADLTSATAVRLFALAGTRRWRDPRTGRMHRVTIEDRGDEMAGPLTVTFQTSAGTCATRYDLDVPLGMAGDPALERLLDRALSRGPGRAGVT